MSKSEPAEIARHTDPRWTLFIRRFQPEFEVISLRGRTGKENRLFFVWRTRSKYSSR